MVTPRAGCYNVAWHGAKLEAIPQLSESDLSVFRKVHNYLDVGKLDLPTHLLSCYVAEIGEQ